jgi:hypothetical protein
VPRPSSRGALNAIRYLTAGAGAVPRHGAAIMLAYPLTEERFREVIRQIAFRRGNRAGTRDQIPESDE